MIKKVGGPTGTGLAKSLGGARRSTVKTWLSLVALVISAGLWTQPAFGCPAWWENYRARLALFGVGASWADGSVDKDRAVEETLEGWRSLAGTGNSEALKALVYDSSLEEITALKAAALDGRPCDLALSNPAAMALIEGRRLDILDYLLFLRQVEAGRSPPDPWEYGQSRSSAAEAADAEAWTPAAVFELAEKASRSDLPPALKRRYVYQVFSLGFAVGGSEYNDKLKALFISEVSAWPENEPVKQWCRSFYAGLLYREGDLTGAFREYARVYAQSWRAQERAHESLHLILGRDAEAGLKTLSLPDLSEAEKQAVQKVLNSFNPDLEAVVRATVAEGWPLPNDINRRLISYLNAENDRRLLKPAPSFPEAQGGLEKAFIALADFQPEPALWLLAAANMAILRGDTDAAGKFLRRAEQSDEHFSYQGQRVILKALSRAYLEPLHERGEAELFEHLSWLFEHCDRGWRLSFDYEGQKTPFDEDLRLEAALRSILWTVLPNRYTAQGRDDRAALVLAAVSEEAGTKPFTSSFPFWKLIQSPPGRLLALADTLNNPQTPFENFLVKAAPWTADYPLELAGSHYLRTHRFDQAARVLARIPEERRRPWTAGSSNWQRRDRDSLVGARNPFDDPFHFSPPADRDRSREALYEKGRACGLSIHSRETLLRLTEAPAGRLEFARQMKRLKELGRQPGELGALSLFHYAQALYNISWHGQSWRMSAWGRSSGETRYADLNSRPYPYYWLDAQIRRYAEINPDDQYHFPSVAEEALKRALVKTNNPELKARLSFMLAAMPPTSREWWREYWKSDYKQQSFQMEQVNERQREELSDLLSRYGDTAFVGQARQSCPLLEEFL